MSPAASGAITGTEDYNVGGTSVSSQTAPVPFTAAYAAGEHRPLHSGQLRYIRRRHNAMPLIPPAEACSCWRLTTPA